MDQKIIVENLLSRLTEEQRKAVNHFEGPALVIAGPGAGKTRTITTRIILLLSKGVKPHHIVAVTFTNKAANEMKERVAASLGHRVVKQLQISTFHSLCWNILTKWELPTRIDYTTYSICDESSSLQIVKELIQHKYGRRFGGSDDLDLPDGVSNSFKDHKFVRREISRIKQNLLTPSEFEEKIGDTNNVNLIELAHFYRRYVGVLRASKLLDFDDLLLHVVKLLIKNKGARRKIQKKIKFLLVDEYQDTNLAQFEMCYWFVGKQQNIFVVGDVDQSIYAFRGADFGNVLKFKEKFPTCKTYYLQKNFRSTRPIAALANELIEYNSQRFEKKIDAVREIGSIPKAFFFPDQEYEARFFSRTIQGLIQNGDASPKDIAILYRTKVQSRRFEEYLVKFNIPYRIIGAVGFYNRKIIKDILAYVRLLYNSKDNLSFMRVVNFPRRGLGKAAVTTLSYIAEENSISLLEVFKYKKFPRENGAFDKFRKMFAKLIKLKNERPDVAIEKLVEITGIKHYCHKINVRNPSDTEKRLKEWEHVVELIGAVKDFADKNDGNVTLKQFVEWVDLLDSSVTEEKDDRVSLMTCHAAKGSEYEYVFLAGCSNFLFPHTNSIFNHGEGRSVRFNRSLIEKNLEEERRLFYVAVTRSKTHLLLGAPLTIQRGRTSLEVYPSLFLTEVIKLVEVNFMESGKNAVRLTESEADNLHRRSSQEIFGVEYVPNKKKPQTEASTNNDEKSPRGNEKSKKGRKGRRFSLLDG